ncbi:SpoIIE family protein phosphatase [Yinghuangia aomiensis]
MDPRHRAARAASSHDAVLPPPWRRAAARRAATGTTEMALPDRTVLVGLGDMAGHGLAATAGMTTLRSALQGFAVAGRPPAKCCIGSTGCCCTRCPRRRSRPRCVRAVRPGAPGADPGRARDIRHRCCSAAAAAACCPRPKAWCWVRTTSPVYEEARLELRAGDVLLCFTDGLVERRGHDIDESLDGLLGLARVDRRGGRAVVVDLVVSRLGTTDYEDDACVMALRVGVSRRSAAA